MCRLSVDFLFRCLGGFRSQASQIQKLAHMPDRKQCSRPRLRLCGRGLLGYSGLERHSVDTHLHRCTSGNIDTSNRTQLS